MSHARRVLFIQLSIPTGRHEHNIAFTLSTHNGSAILLTVRGGPYVLRGVKPFLDDRLTYGGAVVTLMRRPPFRPPKVRGIHFRYRLRTKLIKEKSSDLIGNRIR